MHRIARLSTGEEYTQALARGLAAVLRGGDTVRLEGELGAGKTTFVRALAVAMGAPAGALSSPTFVMVNQYPLRGPHAATMVHVDAYRLRGEEDLEALGWDQFVSSGRARSDVVLVVEWASRIETALDAGGVAVRLSHVDPATREIEIDLSDEVGARPGAAELVEREPTRCPISGAWVEPTRATYPFAGEREKMADLGRWLRGDYRVSREIRESDLDEGA